MPKITPRKVPAPLDFETSEYRAARQQAYALVDVYGAHAVFQQATGIEVNQSVYVQMLDREMDAEKHHDAVTEARRNARSRMMSAAALLEYWYWNADQTLMYREPTIEHIRQSFESGRPGAFWVRLLRIEKGPADQ